MKTSNDKGKTLADGKLASFKRYLSLGSLSVSLLIHLTLFLAVSGIIIVQARAPKVVLDSYGDTPPPMEQAPELPPEIPEDPAPAGTVAEDKADLTQAMAMETIAVSTPQNNYNVVSVVGAPVISTGASGALPSSGGGGGPGGTGKGMGFSVFGSRDKLAKSLTGYMYDLKQTPDHQPTPCSNDNGKARAVVKKFIASGFDEKQLEPYYRHLMPLYCTQMFIPNVASGEAPKAFGAERTIKGMRWIAVYRGEFTSPVGGRFRFAGIGDDYLVVRLNGRIVLDGSLYAMTTGVKRERLGRSPGLDWHDSYFIVAGEWFDLMATMKNTIEIVIGEEPGNTFNAMLFIQKDGESYGDRASAKGAPMLPIFQLTPSALPEGYHSGKNGPEVPDKQFIVN